MLLATSWDVSGSHVNQTQWAKQPPSELFHHGNLLHDMWLVAHYLRVQIGGGVRVEAWIAGYGYKHYPEVYMHGTPSVLTCRPQWTVSESDKAL